MRQRDGFNTYIIGVPEKGGWDTLHKHGSMLFSPSLRGTEWLEWAGLVFPFPTIASSGRLCRINPKPSPAPLPVVLCPVVSLTQGQLWSEKVKWKIPEINHSWNLNCALFWIVWWNLSHSALPWVWIIPLSNREYSVGTPCARVT